jgi:hypothetical protein
VSPAGAALGGGRRAEARAAGLDQVGRRQMERGAAVSALRDIIEAAKAETGLGIGNLTALSPQNDPYRLDTPANHAVGQWFAEQMERLDLLNRRLHLRGIHYQPSVSSDWSWAEQTRALIARKRYGNGAAP